MSTAVVSYVVNEGPRPVAPATAGRVREAMRLLGYRPNETARALRTGSTGTIGLVLGDSRNPFFTEYAFELVQAAADRGKQLLIGSAQHGRRDVVAIVETMLARQVDGLLFAAPLTRFDARVASGLAGKPTVLVDTPAGVAGHRSVGSAARTGAGELVEHLIGHGRQRIALVMGDSGFGNPDPRESGWLAAHAAAGRVPGPLVTVPFTRAGGYAGAVQLLERHPRPDALFASNDLQAIGALRALHERGLSVPDDVAVVSYDGTIESEFAWPPLTVARQDLPVMAAAALDLLAADVASQGRHVEVATRLIVRASCGCAAVGAERKDEPT